MLNSKLSILKFPHPVLSTLSEDIDIMGPNRMDYMQLIDKMEAMYNGGGPWGVMVGLAAPQVGKNWNIFIALNEIFINPRMTVDSLKGYSDLLEGCYSLEDDKYDYPVRRAYKVTLDYQDVNGEKVRKHFKGRDAQVIQHEYDHLQGVCCNRGNDHRHHE